MESSTGPWAALLEPHKNKLLVTFLALTAFLAGFHIPLPFVSQESTEHVQFAQPYSVFALGVSPWVFSTGIAELLLLAVPPLRNASYAAKPHANPFSPIVVSFALALALVQGFAVVQGIAQVTHQNHSAWTLFAAALSIAAGSAAAIALANWIEKSGVGKGFWILIAVGGVFAFAGDIKNVTVYFASPNFDFQYLGVWGILTLLSIGTAVFLVRLRALNGQDDVGHLLWALLAADALFQLFVLVFALTFSYIFPIAFLKQLPGHVGEIYFALQAAFVLAFVFAYARAAKSPELTFFTVLCFAAILLLQHAHLATPLPRWPLTTIGLVLFSYACTSLLGGHREEQRRNKMRHMFTRRKGTHPNPR
jgi:preprotein translocase subunit SecY